jgi:molybdopterin synthase sulfur carrier subunit
VLGCAAVPRITFTSSIQRHVSCPAEAVTGATVREALDQYFARHPQARGYVLDEQGALRQHVVVFVNGGQMRDRAAQQDPIHEADELYVMQALSGG